MALIQLRRTPEKILSPEERVENFEEIVKSYTEDEVVLERVDDNGAPVGPDEPAARTLATGLANRTLHCGESVAMCIWRKM